ncbi:MAG TPA: glucoamylase family protein, partial [Bryobacteraceae bacterium]|nr:glucoamylase family protein [Bryobacteraceae bacterium]
PSIHIGSIAATGFGLTAFCIGAEHGWVPRDQARNRVLTSLRFLQRRAFHDHGWFLHFMDANTGLRRMESEISSIDTALLLAGVLTAQGYFSSDREIRLLAKQIFERVDFTWMLNGSPALLSHGVNPGAGFLKFRWDSYSEASILYLMAIGAARNSIPVDSWYTWVRPEVHYEKWKFISSGPLFTHQFSHAWVNFHHQMDNGGTDYFFNSQMATYAHRDFCINLKSQYGDYGPNMWGITVSDSAAGYVDWGGPPNLGPIDGTIVPCAAAGSLMFTPDICLPALRQMLSSYGDKIYGRYGFTDAFNPGSKNSKLWVNPDVIGIDVGISLLSIENLVTKNVWRWFSMNQYTTAAMERVGFRISTPGIGIKEARSGARKA